VISRLTLTLVPVSENLSYDDGLQGKEVENKEELRLKNEAIRFDSHLIVSAL